jgi:glutaredoxin 3
MKAVMYSKEPCPYCVKAAELLSNRGISVTEIKLQRDISSDDFKSEVEKLTGVIPTTVPQIFIDNEYIGGHDHLVSYFEKEELSGIDFGDFEI